MANHQVTETTDSSPSDAPRSTVSSPGSASEFSFPLRSHTSKFAACPGYTAFVFSSLGHYCCSGSQIQGAIKRPIKPGHKGNQETFPMKYTHAYVS